MHGTETTPKHRKERLPNTIGSADTAPQHRSGDLSSPYHSTTSSPHGQASRTTRHTLLAYQGWPIPLVLLALAFLLAPALAHDGLGFWGAGVCHRIVERTYVIGGQALPLCARCTGIYLGFLTAVVVCFLRGRRRPAGLPPVGIMVVLFLFLLVVGVDGLNSYFSLFPMVPHLYEPNNALRLFSGTLEGVALAGLLLPLLHMTLWETPQEMRSFPNLAELGLVLLAAGVVDLLVIWHPRPSFYPLALLSLTGLVLALGITTTPLLAVLFRRAGRLTRWSEAVLLLGWGMLLALAGMAVMAVIRYLLTGAFYFSLSWL